MTTITIPKSVTGKEELVIIPKSLFVQLLSEKEMREKDVLRWSAEAKKLKRESKLPLLSSLRSLR